MSDNQDALLALADRIQEADNNPIAINPAAAAELRRLHKVEEAYNAWHDKTEWVQDTAQPKELGRHRADILRQRIDRLHAEHHDLGQALARAIERNNELEAELAEQARLNGMGSEREARLKAVNAELVESNRAMLRHCLRVMQEEADAYLAWHSDTNATLLAEIAALKEYLNDKG